VDAVSAGSLLWEHVAASGIAYAKGSLGEN